MGTLTKTQIEAAVKFRIGNRTDIDTQIVDAVQFAFDELIASIRIPETQESAVMTTIEGQAIYSTPTDLYAIGSIRNNTDGERLVPLSIKRYDRVRDVTTKQKPTHYVWWRNELILVPVPDSTTRTIMMRYMKRLSALTTTSSLPREWDEVIIQGAYFRALRWLGLKTEAQAEQGEYIGMVQRRLDRIAETDFDREDTAQPVLVERTTAAWSV